MPNTNPTLSSFLSSTQFNVNVPSANPLIMGMIAGSTFNLPTFSGVCGAAEKDPGGLFGWLIYARNYKSNPTIGNTGNKYIVYSTPSQLVGELNKLSGVTSCLISYTGSGGTFGFFNQLSSSNISAKTPNGNDFLHALHALAYGGSLVIAGSTTGLDEYESTTNRTLEVFLGNTLNNGNLQWFREKSYTVGIFPTGNGSGDGVTASDFATYLGGSQYLTGTTVADRIFNVYGINGGTYSATTLQTGGELDYSIPAIADVAGAFNTAKNLNQIFLTVGGLDRSRILNNKITNTVEWSSALKSTLRTNRVNFYVNYDPTFLGSDLVGATGSASAVSVSERVGPAYLKKVITKRVNDIGTKYLFELNDANTRAVVETEVEAVLDEYSYAIVRSQSYVTCDSTNNTPDYTATLTIDVTVKPILGVDSFVINVSLIS
jgi:hypothetical protein